MEELNKVPNFKIVNMNSLNKNYYDSIENFKCKQNPNLEEVLLTEYRKHLNGKTNKEESFYLLIDTNDDSNNVYAYFSIYSYCFFYKHYFDNEKNVYKYYNEPYLYPLPSILLSNFAKNSNLDRDYSVGSFIIDEYLIPFVKQFQSDLGIWGVSLFAANEDLIEYYKRYGFIEVDYRYYDVPRPSYDDECIFMFLKV